MARIFITGSADGLGQLTAKSLIEQRHQVVLHARNEQRAKDALESVPDAEGVLTGDLSSVEETKQLATAINGLERFDAIIHNAGIYSGSGEDVLAVNVLAPYILTCLVQKPQRLIYLTSDLHKYGKPSLEPIATGKADISYADSKLLVGILTKAVARKWPSVYSNAINPGWVPTKMGGAEAPDDLQKGFETQVWLATSNDEKAKISGRYFHHKKEANNHSDMDNEELQEELLKVCEQITDIRFSV